MSTKEKNTKIAIIGKFKNVYDEEYIAQGFEKLGYPVIRIDQTSDANLVHRKIVLSKPDILLFTKYVMPPIVKDAVSRSREWGMKTVCWVFDLYFGYHREYRVKNDNYFKADYVFTTDGGHENKWKEYGINHHCVRQGMYDKECVLLPFDSIEYELVFIGSDNPIYPERGKLIRELNAKWIGRQNTNEIRGRSLNSLYSKTRIVIGDSFPSPYYWSNRVVETLGRGGFLIHKEVEGIKEEYPYLVTYTTKEDLIQKIEYYKNHEEERREIVKKNHLWVKKHYTCDKKCKELLKCLSK